MRILKKPEFRIAGAGILFALALHLFNGSISHLPDFMHTTADDASYLRPVENFIQTGIWKDNTVGASSYVQRPPLMGLLHGISFFLFHKSAFIADLLFFFLLHGLALYRLPGILRRLMSEKAAHKWTLLYAFMPCFWGFLSYHITEAIASSLVILLLSATFRKSPYQFISILFLTTCIVLLRPVLLALFPVLIPELYRQFRHVYQLRNPLVLSVLIVCMTSVGYWEYRKHHYMGSWLDIHPIYHESNQTLYRPSYATVSEMFRIWEYKPENFHFFTGSCWNGDSAVMTPEAVAPYVHHHQMPFTPTEFSDFLNAYRLSLTDLRQRMQHGPVVRETALEKKFRIKATRTIERLKHGHPNYYHFRSPLHSVADLFTKSQLNLELFQTHLRGNFLIEILRYGCVLLINLLFVATIGAFFVRHQSLRLLAVGALFYCFCIFYLQRMNEDRYLVPLLPVIFVAGSSVLYILSERLRSGKKTQKG